MTGTQNYFPRQKDMDHFKNKSAWYDKRFRETLKIEKEKWRNNTRKV